MTRREQHLTNILRSRGVGVLIALAGIWMAWHALMAGHVMAWPPTVTPLLPAPSTWFSAMPELSFVANIAVLAGVAVLMISVNRRFNILRTGSIFFAAYFFFITCATPTVAGQLGASSLLALAVMACVGLMFSVYAERISSRRVFLSFAILSGGSLIDWSFLFYIPVFMVALGQMKLFKFKKLLAMALGLITPPWIVYGLGLAETPVVPDFFWTPPAIVAKLPPGIAFVSAVGLTVLTGFLLGSLNLLRIIGFNARSRAYNGVLALVSISTALLAIVNFTRLDVYVTLLNATVAFQVGLFFRYSASRRGYIAVLTLLAAYSGLYVWQYYN